MNRIQITAALADRPTEILWAAMLSHVRTLQPFWERAVRLFAERSGFPVPGREKHLSAIAGAFEKVDLWRRDKSKLVKARQKEIDSAISFLRNKALENSISNLCIAPLARNAAGALRVTLSVSAYGYHDHQLPDLLAAVVYDLAEVRSAFPVDTSDLVGFHPGHSIPPDMDPYSEMLQRAGVALGIEDAVERLMREVDQIWVDFAVPRAISFPDAFWAAESEGSAARLHYSAIAAFHRRP